MKHVDMTCKEFVEALASKAPAPGGGGASALVGAIGVALGMMVGNLTVGKPGYTDVEEDVKNLLEQSEALKDELLKLVDEDARVFGPLSRAYKIPKDDPSRGQAMEDALRLACTVPMDIMRSGARVIELCGGFVKKGARGALSDAGICALFSKAALQAASLNVFINTKYMDNRSYVKKINTEAADILEKYCIMADEIYNDVVLKLRT